MKQLKQHSPTSPVEASFHLLLPPSPFPCLISVCLSCQHCPFMHSPQEAPAAPSLGPKAFPATTSSCFLAPPGGTPQSAGHHGLPPLLCSPASPWMQGPPHTTSPPGVSGRKESSQTLNLNPYPSHLPLPNRHQNGSQKKKKEGARKKRKRVEQ